MSEIALIGKKIGMTREFYKTGQLVPVTVLKVEKEWYSLELKEKPHQNLFHIINLDINLLHYYLLEPTLGIGDPRHDNRIDFIAGFHGLEGIEKKVNNGEAKVGFALFATQMEN